MAVLRPQASGGSGRALRAEPAESNTATAPPAPRRPQSPHQRQPVATLSHRAPASDTTRDCVGPQSSRLLEAKSPAAPADWPRRLRQVEQDGTAAGGGGWRGLAGSGVPTALTLTPQNRVQHGEPGAARPHHAVAAVRAPHTEVGRWPLALQPQPAPPPLWKFLSAVS